MSQRVRTLVLLAGAMALSACISARSYVDPQYHKASYESIRRLVEPVPVKLNVEFRRNGEHLPALDAELRGHVERTLRASGAALPAAEGTASISITANNIADLAAARAKGFGTGLTFGAVGSTVDDDYEFSCSFESASHPRREFGYLHAIHTTVGSASGPPGLAPTTPADAFGHVVEDVVLNFIKDLQDQGLIPK